MSQAIEITGVRVGMAVVQRIDQGYDKPLDLAGCIEAAEHPTKGLSRVELVETIAYLGAQVVGYRASADVDSRLVVSQIQSVLREFEERQDVARQSTVEAAR